MHARRAAPPTWLLFSLFTPLHRVPPASGLATPPSGSAQLSQPPSQNASTSHCCMVQKTAPSFERFLATIWASGKAPSLGRRRGMERPFLKVLISLLNSCKN